MALEASLLGSDSATAAAAAEGPVLSLMSKRLRALRKKYNRILQMEASLAQGKTLNKEQEEVLRSKPAVVALIDEYEKLRPPISAAVQEEISRSASCSSSGDPKANGADDSSSFFDAAVEDLLTLLYFGCLFDVKPQSEFTSTMLTRTHERGCCLTYDYVTDDSTEFLCEKDLDMISALGGMFTSRPLYSGISHKSALEGCLQHARLWLQGANQPIIEGSAVTYASLREKLNKIRASDYYTTTPEMKAPIDVAAVVGKYNAACQVQVSESTRGDPTTDTVRNIVPAQYHQQDEEQEDFPATAISPEQSSTMDDLEKDGTEEPNSARDITALQQEQETLEADVEEHNHVEYEQKDTHYVPRRPYQNQRGGRGGRRGYPNFRGRNSRGGGGFQNGRNQYYDPGYQPRNYYNNARGRGGRFGSSVMYNNHHGASSHSGYGSSNIELDASA
ncbi:hypothetical protein AXF42_Ash020447 [Apostasia shenzhenica]|uniref:Uncharacterized protein n=1 Tax=Apostasia shenzhenica TaxID=1088818 RepID=A0A2H9ZYG6_9ASPA|nr:hypothetical protein AXF42_Ash020447 [Apostasia shenzhenica]